MIKDVGSWVEPYYTRGRKWVKGKTDSETSGRIISSLTLPPVSYHGKNIEGDKNRFYDKIAFVELTDSFSTRNKQIDNQQAAHGGI